MSKKKIQNLCVSAVLSAVFVVFEMLSQLLSSFLPAGAPQIPLSAISVIIAAYCISPLSAVAVGGLGSLINQIILYSFSPATLLWIIPDVARGLILAVLFIAFKKQLKFVYILIQSVVSCIVVSVLNSYILFIFDYLPKDFSLFMVALSGRAAGSLIGAVALALITIPLVKGVNRVIKK